MYLRLDTETSPWDFCSNCEEKGRLADYKLGTAGGHPVLHLRMKPTRRKEMAIICCPDISKALDLAMPEANSTLGPTWLYEPVCFFFP